MDIREKIYNYVNLSRKLELTKGEVETANFYRDIKDVLAREGRTEEVFAGQKRVVVEDGNKVIKLVASLQGLQDNTNGLLTSAHLKGLFTEGVISQDDLNLFSLYDMYNNDSFMITSEKQHRITDTTEFINWYDSVKHDNSFKFLNTMNQFSSYFILLNETLRKDYTRILNIIASYFVGSDLDAVKVPENFAISSTGRLVLIDLGSIVPRFNFTEIVCSSCGSPKYLVVLTDNVHSVEDVDTLTTSGTGTYRCSNHSCEFYVGNINENSVSNNTSDHVVFQEYLDSLRNNMEYIKALAVVCNIYIPSEYGIDSYSKYRDSVLANIGKIDEVKIVQLYKASLPVMLSSIYCDLSSSFNQLNTSVTENGGYVSFRTYAHNIYTILVSYEIIPNNNILPSIYMTLATILFIKLHSINSNSSLDIFGLIGNGTNKHTFLSYMNQLPTIDKSDYDNIWTMMNS